eukprot:440121_1
MILSIYILLVLVLPTVTRCMQSDLIYDSTESRYVLHIIFKHILMELFTEFVDMYKELVMDYFKHILMELFKEFDMFRELVKNYFKHISMELFKDIFEELVANYLKIY